MMINNDNINNIIITCTITWESEESKKKWKNAKETYIPFKTSF